MMGVIDVFILGVIGVFMMGVIMAISSEGTNTNMIKENESLKIQIEIYEEKLKEVYDGL